MRKTLSILAAVLGLALLAGPAVADPLPKVGTVDAKGKVIAVGQPVATWVVYHGPIPAACKCEPGDNCASTLCPANGGLNRYPGCPCGTGPAACAQYPTPFASPCAIPQYGPNPFVVPRVGYPTCSGPNCSSFR